MVRLPNRPPRCSSPMCTPGPRLRRALEIRAPRAPTHTRKFGTAVARQLPAHPLLCPAGTSSLAVGAAQSAARGIDMLVHQETDGAHRHRAAHLEPEARVHRGDAPLAPELPRRREEAFGRGARLAARLDDVERVADGPRRHRRACAGGELPAGAEGRVWCLVVWCLGRGGYRSRRRERRLCNLIRCEPDAVRHHVARDGGSEALRQERRQRVRVARRREFFDQRARSGEAPPAATAAAWLCEL
mmetsp:Transcript_7491/g.24667  ORF Transcript_7491/g.24667 Transcript_7491/m.24667 type:complete len:244 (-) Transcript_7491:402-1133(-)